MSGESQGERTPSSGSPRSTKLPKELGERIKQQLDVSQGEFAEVLQLSRATISKFLNGEAVDKESAARIIDGLELRGIALEMSGVLPEPNFHRESQSETPSSATRNINTGGGDYREITNQGTYVEGDYYNSPAAKQTLLEAAAEIQQLLEQLGQAYSPATIEGKMQLSSAVIKQIEANTELRGRVLQALETPNAPPLDSFLHHPAANLVITTLRDWQANHA